MNNEEKILQILTQMQGKLDTLEQGQKNLEQKVDNLEQGQRNLEKIVLRMEQEHGEKITALFDSYSVNLNLTKEMEPRVVKLEDRVDDHDLAIEFLKSSAK